MQRITEATRECFNAIVQVRRADPAGLPPPEVLHRSLRQAVDQMMTRAAQLGFTRDDVDDLAYAVVAFGDEVVASRSDPLAAYWAGHSLSVQYFRDANAGEGFFTRLASVQRDGARRREVLQAFGLALLLGFQGKYRFRGRELELLSLQEDVHRELLRGSGADPGRLSPHGERPDAGARARARGGAPLWTAVAAVAAAVLLWVGMSVSLRSGASDVQQRVAAELARLGFGGGR